MTQNRNWLFILATYIVVYFGFLYYSDFLPYVLDNNETYSSLVHAYNMFYGDWTVHYGLADEAFSLDPTAHPILHTHQGNWPRILAFIFFALGARSAEAQIFLHVFSIGLLSIWLMYKFFAELCSAKYALIACAIFMTDYMLFAQWQVVTHRVWHCFFVFSSLLCMLHIDSKDKKWLLLTILNFAALYYWELVFAFYVSCWSLLFYSFSLRTVNLANVRKALRCGLFITAGGLISLGLLFSQLVLFMGVKNVLHDFYYTFVARNFTGDPLAAKQVLQEFYADKNIAFFFNIVDGASYQGVTKLIKSIFAHGFQFHTPILTLFSLLCVFALVLHMLSKRFKDQATIALRAAIKINIAVLSLFFIVLLSGLDFLGLSTININFSFAFALPFAALTAVAIHQLGFGGSAQVSRLQVINLNVFLFGAVLLMLLQPTLYAQPQSLLWFDHLTKIFDPAIWQLLTVALIILIAVALVHRLVYLQNVIKIPNLLAFLAAGLIAYAIVYLISPGYMYVGYLDRTAPFIVFFVDAVLAVTFCCLYAIADRKAPFYNKYLGFIAVFTLAMMSYFWFTMQYAYIGIYPPDSFSFVKILRNAEFQQRGIVSNKYSLPFAYETKSWAYTDESIGARRSILSNNGYQAVLDLDYLWYKNRLSYAGYSQPSYFVCFTQNTIDIGISRLRGQPNSLNSCLGNRTFNKALLLQNNAEFIAGEPQHKILDKDHYLTSWAILQMDWSNTNTAPHGS